ncbi:MAG: biopolymer transporter Tol [Ignavibacteria bacterium]|jgi:Tol biopolymer transport system component
MPETVNRDRLISRSIIITAFLLFVLVNSSFAQFGQNKVQYKTFTWSYLQSSHFDIYFAEGGDYIAQFTAAVAESSLVDLTNNIGYEIKKRIPIIVYDSHNDFQQTNVLDEYLPEGVGGVTELFKNRINVPFEGDYSLFRHVIHHELLHAYMNDMYYGGSLQNIISQNIRLQFPIWFDEGMAEYQSLGGNDKANDMFMRDAVIYDYLPPLEYIDGYLAYRGGQSFFAWLADEYGKEKIGDLMQEIKGVGDVEMGFRDIYKASIEELSKKWQKSLKQSFWPDIASRQEVTDFASKITDHKKGDGFYNTAPALSPKGDKIAFISNRDDYFDVFVENVKTRKVITKLIKGNRTANFEELHLLTPGLCWSPNGEKIAISVKGGEQDVIYIIDVESEDQEELPIKFDGIFSVNWNPIYQSLVFVGDNSQQSDIWVYDLLTKKLRQITNDVFSDADPTWSADGNKIYFESDRGEYTELDSIPQNLRIQNADFTKKNMYEYDMKTGTLKKFIAGGDATITNVVSSPDGKKVLFISDKNGINNIWLKNLETSEEYPITNSIDPISILSLSHDGKRVAFSALHDGGYDLFYIENPFDMDSKAKDMKNTLFVDQMLSKEKKDTLQQAALSDSLDRFLKQSNQKIAQLEKELQQPTDSLATEKKDSLKSLYGKGIDLNLNPFTQPDTVSFGTRPVKLKEKAKFNLSDNTNPDGSLKVNKYKIKFSPDIIYSNVAYSSFYGVQGLAQMAFSDMLGNHRIYVAVSLVLDLKNSDYAFAYYYLPKRIDYGGELFHSARFLYINTADAGDQLYRFETYGLNLSMSFPIDKFNRIDGALSLAEVTKENLDDPTVAEEKLQFGLPILSYVHDNTLFGMTAPIRGTRYNLTFLGTPRVGADGLSFFSSMLDYRTYFRFFNDYNFVWRFNGGFSVGPNPQRFYIGGTDNWINYTLHNDSLPISDIRDYAFATPILPMRGFDYNERSGSKFMLMNTEFRFPLFRYLVLGPLPLAFQNIMGVAFMDLGSVWSDNKSLKFITRNNGTVVTNDLLMGMGVGARIFLLYFPLKFDVAWSYNLQHFSQPKYYISLGSDF